MAPVNTLVITGYGTNSHLETAHTARLAGSDRADVVHFSDLISGECRLSDYNFLIFPGGFLDGDDLGAAQTAAMRWRSLSDAAGKPLLRSLEEFLDAGGLVLGICNGFQLLVKLGVLPALDGARFERQASLGHNDSARFEDRWVRLLPNPESPCVFTRGLSLLAMPVRHGEGKLVCRDEATLARLAAENLIALQYADPEGRPTQEYPWNPNGSPLAIAGLTDPTGHVLGLMPHPEAFHHVTNHPGWTRGELAPPGTLLFANAVRYLRAQEA
ncbi:MAG: phosphoribosylformylglycinamidine synthase subunit PurQ [Desulfovibrio sp.]|uniref:phosphoribosylformylglycinamidine synthase subunit PurQ n=1 Tax=Desulfovibrio sp. TaxID=885 RepID=UPI001A76FFCC|nr:phosphoribosylformylglycinamidine synthase subunit PurQ [Desulfovibrio sp.]MBD5417630.1 phosphoribosylformylglycinamidine synthase subunit PurQ [Desulfovibrio sp.]